MQGTSHQVLGYFVQVLMISICMSKSTCENSLPLAISRLRKSKFLLGFCTGNLTWDTEFQKHRIHIAVWLWGDSPHIRLTYSAEGERIEYDVELTTTPCNYGGKRFWFVCPAARDGVECGRRVGVLYASGTYFACRKCCHLAYQSQQKRRRQLFGIFGTFLELSDEFDEKERTMRVKYWKGRPTKRYAKLLRKAGKIPTLEQLAGFSPYNPA